MPLRKKPLPRKRIFRKNVKEERSELNPAKFKDHIEVIGKSVLGVLAFCYAVGILVESLYLGNFGVYHVSIFRFTYVFAGIWALLIFILPMLPIIWTGYYLLFLYRSLARIQGLVVLLGLVAVEYVLASRLQLKINFSDIIYSSCAAGAILFISSYVRNSENSTDKQVSNILFVVFPLCFFMLFLGTFSKYTFPQISARFGGGKPLTVQLLLEANKRNAWMIQENFDLCESDRAQITSPDEVQLVATKPMRLLLATDSDYIIRKRDETTAISISRDQVKTVLYLDNFDYSRDVCAGPDGPGPSPSVVPEPQQ